MAERIIMDGLEIRVQLQGIKAIIFDFDGTLALLNIDFSSMRDRIFDLVRQAGIKESRIQEKYLLEIIDEVYEILRKEKPSGAEGFYQESHQVLHEIEMKAAGEGRLIPGTENTLNNLRDEGIRIGIVTRNCEAAVRKVFPDIEHYCDAFISRDSVENVKPHPDHLNTALEVLKVSGEEAMMVGDHTIDIQAGKRVGMKTVGVLTGRIKREEFEEAEADYILKDVSEIYPLLKEGI